MQWSDSQRSIAGGAMHRGPACRGLACRGPARRGLACRGRCVEEGDFCYALKVKGRVKNEGCFFMSYLKCVRDSLCLWGPRFFWVKGNFFFKKFLQFLHANRVLACPMPGPRVSSAVSSCVQCRVMACPSKKKNFFFCDTCSGVSDTCPPRVHRVSDTWTRQ